jgi:hypothetical protein
VSLCLFERGAETLPRDCIGRPRRSCSRKRYRHDLWRQAAVSRAGQRDFLGHIVKRGAAVQGPAQVLLGVEAQLIGKRRVTQVALDEQDAGVPSCCDPGRGSTRSLSSRPLRRSR